MSKDCFLKVLCIDGIKSDNEIITCHLVQENIQVFFALCDKDALVLITENQFNLFLIDIVSSGMNGYELAKKIRAFDDYQHTPIIFLIASNCDIDGIHKGIKLEAVDYLIKPIDIKILISKVKYFLALNKKTPEMIAKKTGLAITIDRFFEIARIMADWMWEVDITGRFVYVSDRVEEFLGYKPTEIIGKTPLDFMTVDEGLIVKPKYEKIRLKCEPIVNLIKWNVTKSGKRVCIITNGFPIFDCNRKLTGYHGINKDITSQIIMKNELRFQTRLLKNVNDSIIYTDLNGIIQFVNEGTKVFFCENSEEFIGNNISQLLPDIFNNQFIVDLHLLSEANPIPFFLQFETRSGAKKWLRLKMDLLHTPEGSPEGYIFVGKDVTLSKNAEEAVVKSIIFGEEKERERISGDLHDGLGQLLTASLLNFKCVTDDIDSFGITKQKEYYKGLQFLGQALEEVRNIVSNLMPNNLAQCGLISTLTTLFNSVQNEIHPKINFTENLNGIRLEPQIELNLYRISQEILTNALRHSKANTINFHYELQYPELRITYNDDGIGFDFSDIQRYGVGINSMMNRVKSMSGFININSNIGIGTTIIIVINIEKK